MQCPGCTSIAPKIYICAQFNFSSSNRWEGPQNQGWIKGWELAGWEVSSARCLDVPNYIHLVADGIKRNCVVHLKNNNNKKNHVLLTQHKAVLLPLSKKVVHTFSWKQALCIAASSSQSFSM